MRRLAAPAVSSGFAEVSAAAARVTNPADAERTLDTFYEIIYAKEVQGSLEDAFPALKFAMSLEKTAASKG